MSMHISQPSSRKNRLLPEIPEGDPCSGAMIDRGRISRRCEQGVLLIEIMVAILILSVGLLALAAATGHAARLRYHSRSDMELWAAVQSQADSLTSAGYSNLIDGWTTVQGHPLNWTVTGTNLKTLVLRWERPSRIGPGAIPDSLIMYFRKP